MQEKGMEKNEKTKKYELMLIIDARLTDADKEATLKASTDLIVKEGGKVLNSQVWAEKQKLSFEIKKCQMGTYYLINLEGAGAMVHPLESKLRLDERVLRFSIIQQEKKLAAV